MILMGTPAEIRDMQAACPHHEVVFGDFQWCIVCGKGHPDVERQLKEEI